MTYGTFDGMLHSIIKEGLCVMSAGDTDDEDLGQFHVVEIPADADKRAEMRTLAFAEEKADDYETEADIFDRTEAGWYFVTVRSMGRVFAFQCENEEEATYDFESLKRDYLHFKRTGK